jgi:hypothetical protein
VDGGEQVLLRADVVVQRALAQIVGDAQLGDAGRVVAAPGEHTGRRVDDGLVARLPVRVAPRIAGGFRPCIECETSGPLVGGASSCERRSLVAASGGAGACHGREGIDSRVANAFRNVHDPRRVALVSTMPMHSADVNWCSVF